MTHGFQGAVFAKPHCAVGEPVSPAAEHARFETLAACTSTGSNLTLALDRILPGVTQAVQAAGQLALPCPGAGRYRRYSGRTAD
jgi:hypothetical protein